VPHPCLQERRIYAADGVRPPCMAGQRLKSTPVEICSSSIDTYGCMCLSRPSASGDVAAHIQGAGNNNATPTGFCLRKSLTR
jgi:hypothetical protein